MRGARAKGTHLTQRNIRIPGDYQLCQSQSRLCSLSSALVAAPHEPVDVPGYPDKFASLSSAAMRLLLSGDSVSANVCAISDAISSFVVKCTSSRGTMEDGGRGQRIYLLGRLLRPRACRTRRVTSHVTHSKAPAYVARRSRFQSVAF